MPGPRGYDRYSEIFAGRSASSSLNDVVQPSHIRAVRSSTADTRPPFHNRGRGFCTGRGDRNASWMLVNLPSYVTSSSVHSRVRMVTALLEPRDPLGLRHAVQRELLRPVAEHESRGQPPTRQYVDVRQRLGQYDGVVQRRHDARRSRSRSASVLRGQPGQRGQDLVVPGPVQVPFAEHDPLESGLLGQPRLLDGVLQLAAARPGCRRGSDRDPAASGCHLPLTESAQRYLRS